MDTREGSNSVSTSRAPQSTEKIVELPKSSLRTDGRQDYISLNQKLYRVKRRADGLYRGTTYDVSWLVRLV